ncbi:hypothetical protein B0H67DRAFT_595169 [Lasiosphaeris hirsuta]|uniref:Uncharacterized protein n=1 Tax=Lasiosphaeris hirsuta TaxID=260670 RepID=A0AA39ZSH2_9PEZI|nr:hypothetical protein B0H67DRAFT_595169 [Lasiosphaeris hirsuta]
MPLTTSTIIKTIADPDGFQAAGALTTTFTPPAGCNKILSTSSSTLAFLGTDYFSQSLCYPGASTQDAPLIRIYFQPGLVCPSGWTSELISGARTSNTQLPLLRADETAAVCCPTGLRYTETIMAFAPGVGGWCLGPLAKATSIEAERCANCDGVPTPLPVVNEAGVAMTLVQTTLLLRRGAVLGVDSGTGSLPPTGTSSSPPPSNSSNAGPESRLSSAAKTGIAVGVIIGIILLGFALGAMFIKRRRQRKRMRAFQSLDEAKEVHGTSAEITELVGDTNPHMKTHELGKGVKEVLSVAPVVYMEPVELDAASLNRRSYREDRRAERRVS